MQQTVSNIISCYGAGPPILAASGVGAFGPKVAGFFVLTLLLGGSSIPGRCFRCYDKKSNEPNILAIHKPESAAKDVSDMSSWFLVFSKPPITYMPKLPSHAATNDAQVGVLI